jgi:hypothetical protein
VKWRIQGFLPGHRLALAKTEGDFTEIDAKFAHGGLVGIMLWFWLAGQ